MEKQGRVEEMYRTVKRVTGESVKENKQTRKMTSCIEGNKKLWVEYVDKL